MPLLKTSTLSADGTTDVVYCDGGEVWITANGTWGSGTLTPYISLDGGTNYAPLTTVAPDGTLTNVAFTEDTALKLSLPDCHIKFTLTGSTSPSLKTNTTKMSKV